MATFVRPDIFSKNLCDKILDLDTDSMRWALVANANAPVVGTTNTIANVTQIAAGGGYTQWAGGGVGGFGASLSALSQSGASTLFRLSAPSVFTASGAVGTFRWPILIDDTPTSPADPVIGWLDHGSDITMAATDTYTLPGAPTTYLTIG